MANKKVDEKKIKTSSDRLLTKNGLLELIEKEGTHREFIHIGLRCQIQRQGNHGQLNGYVSVPKSHPLYNINYSDSYCIIANCDIHRINSSLDVHRGIKYTGMSVDGKWVFGFDTMHSGDIAFFDNFDTVYPGDIAFFDRVELLNADDKNATYKDMAYVIIQTKKLAEQLADLDKWEVSKNHLATKKKEGE